jgi:hypothetical protein
MSKEPQFRYITVMLEEMRAQKLYKIIIDQVIDMSEKIEYMNFEIAELRKLLGELGITDNMTYSDKWRIVQNAKKLLEKDKYAGV